MTDDKTQTTSEAASHQPIAARDGGLALAGIIGLAVLQPVFSLLSTNPGFLTAHDLLEGRLIGFVLGLGLGLPILVAGAFLLLRLLPPRHALSNGFGTLLFGLASAAFALQLWKRAVSAPVLAVGLALLIGGLAMVGFRRFAALRQFAGLLALGLLVYPLVFLLSKDVRPLLRSPPVEDADLAGTLAPGGPDIPVVLVVFDELPVSTLMTVNQEIDAQRFPGFARLAQSATWYRRTTAAAESTAKAIPAIATGRLPLAGSEPVLAEYPNNLFRWLGSNGYRLVVTQNHTLLCPRRLCEKTREPTDAVPLLTDLSVLYGHVLAPEAWGDRLPAVDQTWRGFLTARTRTDLEAEAPPNSIPRIFEHFTSQIPTESARTLYYLHLGVPHVPWKYLPSGREYGPVGKPVTPLGFLAPRWGNDAWATTIALQRHVLQTQYADQLLSRLQDRLQEAGVWDNALVIVTADHGTSFRPSLGRRVIEQFSAPATAVDPARQADENLEDILEVPLFIKRPGQQEGATSNQLTSTLDIVPTIGDTLGAAVPWETEGITLTPDQQPVPRVRRYHTGTYGRGTLEIRADDDRRQATLARKQQLLGSGDDSLYAISPHQDLVGRSATQMVTQAGAPLELGYGLSDSSLYEKVDLEARFLPAHIFATLTGPDDALKRSQSDWFAVAVGGTIRAVTRPILSAQSMRLSALVPEEVFRTGTNQVAIYQISPDGLGLHALRTDGQGHVVRLLSLGDVAQAIQVLPETKVAVDPYSVVGEIRMLDDRIDGVAARRSDRRPYEELFLFRDNELLYRGSAHRQRSQNSPHSGDFRLELTTELLGDKGALRVFARVGDIASELRRAGGPPPQLALRAARAGRNDQNRVQLELEDGTIVPVAARIVTGNVDRIEVEGDQLVFEGWALHRTQDVPPKEFGPTGLVLLVNEVGKTSNYESTRSPAATRAEAFRIEVPLSALDREGFWIRLFALTHTGEAGELKHHGRRLTLVAREAVGWGDPNTAAAQ